MGWSLVTGNTELTTEELSIMLENIKKRRRGNE
jgi:hypothetical protein